MKIQILERTRNLEKWTNNLLSNGMLPEQVEVVKLFNRFNELRELAQSSINTYCVYLKMFCSEVKKPFDQMTKEDIENYLISLKDKSEKTKSLMKVVLKKFFQWFYKMEDKEYPDIVKWIKTSIKNARRKMPEELLTSEEVLALANASDNLRDKALILTLFESACRAGEICNLRIKDISSDNYGILLTVSGKTGMRKVRLVNSTNNLILWVNNHPMKDNPDAPIFFSFNHGTYGKMLDSRGIYNILTALKKKAGIKKKVHPHLFRHSRLSELTRKGYPESFLRQFAGWTPSSNMPEVYIHLSAKNIDEMMLDKEGLRETRPKEVVEVLKPIQCPKCSEMNSATNKFCGKCATPLDQNSIMKTEAQNLIFEVLWENPKIQAMLKPLILEKEIKSKRI